MPNLIDEGIILDMDTPRDYQVVLGRFTRKDEGGSCINRKLTGDRGRSMKVIPDVQVLI